MSEKKPEKGKAVTETEANAVPEYIPPKIKTYTSDEILEQIGPAMACSPSPEGLGGCSIAP